MSTRHRRISLSALSVCIAMIGVVTLPIATLFTSAPSSAAATPPPATNVLRLNVTAANTSVAKNGPIAGQHVSQYKWLIQQDTTGDPNQASGPVAANDGTYGCVGSTCTLTSPSAPFQYTPPVGNFVLGHCPPGSRPDASSPDLASNNPLIPKNISWTLPNSTLVSASVSQVCDAQTVVLTGIQTSPANVAVPPVVGTLLFSILRPDPCHPLTPATQQGDPNFPASCNWPSIKAASHAPIVTQGDQTDWSRTQTLSGVMQTGPNKGSRCALGTTGGCSLPALPNGKYFVSVTADGYDIGGAGFTLPLSADAATGRASRFATINVGLNPGPLTLGTMKLFVFDDMAPTSQAFADTSEGGMSGFTGYITDFNGDTVSQDYFGNPLCTIYQTDAQGRTVVNPDGTPAKILHLGGRCESKPAQLGLLLNPIGAADTTLTISLLPGATAAHLPATPFVVTIDSEQIQVNSVDPTGTIFSGLVRGFNSTRAAHVLGSSVSDPSNQPLSDGIITIPNLAPGRYGANVVPPDKGWIQTTTLEGAHDHDVWVMGNDSGLDTELIAGNEAVPFVNFGFARGAMVNIDPGLNPPATDTLVPVNAADTTNGAFVSAGCQMVPAGGEPDAGAPSGDIRAQLTAAMQPCYGTGITPRIEPGNPGQQPTKDGSLQADSWMYPWYDDPVYHLGSAPDGAKKPTGELKGVVAGTEPYVPGIGGINGVTGANGQAGVAEENILISDGFVALADFNNGEQTAIVAPTKNDGSFDITNIPDGTYDLAAWDWDQDYMFENNSQVTISNGQVVNLGPVPLASWWAKITGTVFIDKNGNGKQDPGEKGVPDFLMQLLNRTNNAYEGGQNVATTVDNGYYSFKEAYPLGSDVVLQFYNPRYKTTGVTCQSDNDPQQHTMLTPAVDLSTLDIISLDERCDIGIQPYSTDPTANDNGGIVATAMYHSFRTELSEEQAFTMPFDTGQPGVRFELWQPKPLPTTTSSNGATKYVACTQDNVNAHAVSLADCPNGLDGSLARDGVPWTQPGQVSVYDSEHWGRPGSNAFSQPGCVPRTADGQVLNYKIQDAIKLGGDCIESALQGTSSGFGSDGNPLVPTLFKPATGITALDPGATSGVYDTNHTNPADPYPGLNAYCDASLAADAKAGTPDPVGTPPSEGQCGIHGVQTVDGNYGLVPPTPGDYIVHAILPNDMFGKPLYKFSTEATNNTYDGPGWTVQNPSNQPQWPVTAHYNGGPHTSPGYSLTPSTGSPFANARCVGPTFTVNNTKPNGPDYVSNPSFVNAYGGSPPFEGLTRNMCDSKLVHVQNGQSYAPNFLLYTDVPLAANFNGYATDDISVSTNKLSTGLGEVQPVPNLPIGIYDWTGRNVETVNTDYNGQWEVLLPSTDTFNCNTVAGPCPEVYRFVGNDPGQPAAPNLNWNPAYITIAAQFQAWPNIYEPSDVAPTRMVLSFEGQGQQLTAAAICAPRASQPQVMVVSHPFFKPAIGGAGGRPDTYNLVIRGLGFGTKPTVQQLQTDKTLGVTLRMLKANGDTDPTGVVKQFGSKVPGDGLAYSQITSWTDNEIDIQLASGNSASASNNLTGLSGVTPGPYQLTVKNTGSLYSTSAVTFHVMGDDTHGHVYSPRLYEVGPFNSGILNSAGAPAGTAIVDNGSVNPNMPGSNGPVQNLVDSTTGFNPATGVSAGFNPNNPNFLPPNATPGDNIVKGAVQRSLEAADHFWQPNIGVLAAALLANSTSASVQLAPGQTTADLPTGPFTVTIGNEQIPVSSVSGPATAGATVTLNFTGQNTSGHAKAATVVATKTGQDQNLIVVYPNFQKDPTTGKWGGVPFEPLSAYFENIVIHSPVMLQGVGPGGFYKDRFGATVTTPGTTLDGRFFNAATNNPPDGADGTAGNEPWAVDWTELVGLDGNADGLAATEPFANNVMAADGEVVFVVGSKGRYTSDGNGYQPSLDGFGITGGNQKNFPFNIEETSGKSNPQIGPEETFVIDTQGGGVNLLSYVENFQVSNNLIEWNNGSYGGAVRSGSPQVITSDGDPNAHNSNLHIHHNRVVADGGTNLAGAIGIFRGTDHYRINDNEVCGGLAAEYGAGISHFGYSPGGQIDHNQIMLNQAIDEGGGISIAGEPPINYNTNTPDPTMLSIGAGPVSIHDNYIGDNLSYDDGGGIRFLEAGPWQFDVTNNMITDNVSSHEGGGVAIDNAPDVRLVNNTIANNITTATAATSDGQPAPAGVSTVAINDQLKAFLGGAAGPLQKITVDDHSGPQACADLFTQQQCDSWAGKGTVSAPATPTPFSDPLILNDVFSGNWAGTWDGLRSTVDGIGLPQNLQFSAATAPPDVVNPGDPTLASPCPSNGTLPACQTPAWDNTVNEWDIGVVDGSDTPANQLNPIHSLLNSQQGWAGPGVGNIVPAVPGTTVDPKFVQAYPVAIASDPYRLQPQFRPSTLITTNFPANVLGDYHIQCGSPAVGMGFGGPANTVGGTPISSPGHDIDADSRPLVGPDSGADQLTAACQAAVVPPVGGGLAVGAAIAGGSHGNSGSGPSGSTTSTTAPAAKTVSKPKTGSSTVAPPGSTHTKRSSKNGVGGLESSIAVPPAGSSLNALAVGAPNSAGNTDVVPLYGTGHTSSGTPVLPPKVTGSIAAPMPGGVAGGGKFMPFKLARHTATPAKPGSPLWPYLVITVGLFLLGTASRLRKSGTALRNSKHRKRSLPDVPLLDDTASPATRPSALAGKGDRS